MRRTSSIYSILMTILIGITTGLLITACIASAKNRNQTSVQSTPKDVYLIGHRGAAGLAPENTIAAFRWACEIGVDALELDVLLTADGEIVVHHDFSLKPELARTSDGKWIEEHSALVINDLTFLLSERA